MGQPRRADDRGRCDVLVVGAGPTGLTLAAQLQRFGVSLRLVDAAGDRVHESRALGVQPRTLEVLRPFGVAEEMVARGNPTVRLRITAGRRTATAPLFDIGTEDTAFPFLLFLSQAETEAVLHDRLAARGVEVDRPVTFESYEPEGDVLRCTLRRADGVADTVRARFLVGCDGAHSAVRHAAGIPFRGGRYPQTFLLADLDADGLEPGTVNSFLGPEGPVFFFPLERPAPWRLIAMRTEATERVDLAELQRSTDRATGGGVRLHDPVWTSVFRIHHRAATRYRAGPVFLAGDAAHVHSPAGAQGMNTGIQDAINLGWKLALACRGAPDALLDSYDAERRAVGEFVLRFTDRLFTVATASNPLLRAVRSRIVPRVLPLALGFRAGRRMAFRTVSQLGIAYRRSPLSEPAAGGRRGPRPGDRLPDARVQRQGEQLWLHEALSAPAFALLLCGPADGWDATTVEALCARHEPWLTAIRLAPGTGDGPADFVDRPGGALARLGVPGAAALLVRPDGHVAHRAEGTDLAGVERYLARWLPPSNERRRVSIDNR
jgi:2-polyprenyl-6-methoxyphenol hydroxylase-like FAD-dependent oxidoreductase